MNENLLNSPEKISVTDTTEEPASPSETLPSESPETSPSESPETLPSEPQETVASKPPKSQVSVPVHRWFVTFMCMNIPVIGWIYLLILAFSPSKGPRRDFAKAYLLYKLLFLLISLAILAVALHYGLLLLDKVLAYMEML